MQFTTAVLYYGVNAITPFPPVSLNYTFIDHFFPPNPFAIWIYLSFFILLITAFIGVSTEQALSLCKVLITNAVIASVFFFFIPTILHFENYAPYIESGSISYQLIYFVKSADDTKNCLPSLHIANSIVASIFLARQKPWHIKSLVVLWLVAIMWSVISIKQHYLYDIIAGGFLAHASLWLFSALAKPRLEP